MNESNYGTLEACKKLVEKGIVLRTEAVWATDGCDWRLMSRNYIGSWLYCIPALSMAEAWRELPERIGDMNGYEFLRCDKDENDTTCGYGQYAETGRSPNPIDALIELIIWLKENKDERR